MAGRIRLCSRRIHGAPIAHCTPLTALSTMRRAGRPVLAADCFVLFLPENGPSILRSAVNGVCAALRGRGFPAGKRPLMDGGCWTCSDHGVAYSLCDLRFTGRILCGRMSHRCRRVGISPACSLRILLRWCGEYTPRPSDALGTRCRGGHSCGVYARILLCSLRGLLYSLVFSLWSAGVHPVSYSLCIPSVFSPPLFLRSRRRTVLSLLLSPHVLPSLLGVLSSAPVPRLLDWPPELVTRWLVPERAVAGERGSRRGAAANAALASRCWRPAVTVLLAKAPRGSIVAVQSCPVLPSCCLIEVATADAQSGSSRAETASQSRCHAVSLFRCSRCTRWTSSCASLRRTSSLSSLCWPPSLAVPAGHPALLSRSRSPRFQTSRYCLTRCFRSHSSAPGHAVTRWTPQSVLRSCGPPALLVQYWTPSLSSHCWTPSSSSLCWTPACRYSCWTPSWSFALLDPQFVVTAIIHLALLRFRWTPSSSSRCWHLGYCFLTLDPQLAVIRHIHHFPVVSLCGDVRCVSSSLDVLLCSLAPGHAGIATLCWMSHLLLHSALLSSCWSVPATVVRHRHSTAPLLGP
jgi:hypothetical protein